MTKPHNPNESGYKWQVQVPKKGNPSSLGEDVGNVLFHHIDNDRDVGASEDKNHYKVHHVSRAHARETHQYLKQGYMSPEYSGVKIIKEHEHPYWNKK